MVVSLNRGKGPQCRTPNTVILKIVGYPLAVGTGMFYGDVIHVGDISSCHLESRNFHQHPGESNLQQFLVLPRPEPSNPSRMITKRP